MNDVPISKVIEARPAAPPRTGRLPRAACFTAVTSILVLFQAASSAVAPMYVVYQRLWGFSSVTLTLIFAIYVFALLGTLLVAGSLSDHAGRRPVLLAAIALEAAAIAVFLLAGGVTALLVARAVQGVATGIALPALAAGLVDFDPPHAPGRAAVVNGGVPIGALALGALGCGALVQYGPDPTHLIWALLLALTVLAAPVVLALPESSARQPGGMRSLLPRLAVPHRLRRDVRALLPIIVASWALGGLYLSLGPSVVVAVFGVANHFVAGLVVTLLCGTGAVTAFALRGRPAAVVSRTSVTLLAAGPALTLLGTAAGVWVAAIAGTVLAGIGYGASGLATFAVVARLAGPADAAERGGLFAVAYTAAFLAYSLPAVAAGYAATRVGLHTTVAVYALLVIAIAAATCAIQETRTAGRA
ncbi:MAG TPA: MFS transporter [Streptosporangiaceae bacterium]|jgi:MFS family permease